MSIETSGSAVATKDQQALYLCSDASNDSRLITTSYHYDKEAGSLTPRPPLASKPRHEISTVRRRIVPGVSLGSQKFLPQLHSSSSRGHVSSSDQHSLLLVGITARRKDPSWGLFLSLFEEKFLVLGRVRPSFHQMTLWARVIAYSPNLLAPVGLSDKEFYAQLQTMPAVSNSPMQLMPGDAILSINGRPMHQFKSLSAVTMYLRQCNQVSLLALRYSAALLQAQSILHSSSSWEVEPSQSYLAAERSYQALKQALSNGFCDSYSHAGAYSTPLTRTFINGHSTLNPYHSFHSTAPPGGLISSSAGSEKAPAARKRLFSTAEHLWPSLRFTNPLFHDEHGKEIAFSDNDYKYDPEDGIRHKFFITDIKDQSFTEWLQSRKETWRKGWKICRLEANTAFWDDEDDSEPSIRHDFWQLQGYPSFDLWLAASTNTWKRSYSWNRRKRQRLEKESEEVVHFPSDPLAQGAETELQQWLRVRKNQWRIMRRKRERERVLENGSPTAEKTCTVTDGSRDSISVVSESKASSSQSVLITKSPEILCIDALLEEKEERNKELEARPPLDISFLFDPELGCPDDAAAHCLRYLHPSEHGKILCISQSTRTAIRQRDHMWRQLCPTRWNLPRRPRKPWYVLYITRMRCEEQARRKRSDDLLAKAAVIVFNGDNLNQMQKLVNHGQKAFDFDVDYVSGVVCERNSLLNLAVVHGRQKTVRWLVDAMGADIESFDRGNFTPLMNAAWEGDRYLVRFLMSKGADRSKIGTGHCSQALAPPEFKGLTAEGWAIKRGHSEVAELIRMGLP